LTEWSVITNCKQIQPHTHQTKPIAELIYTAKRTHCIM